VARPDLSNAAARAACARVPEIAPWTASVHATSSALAPGTVTSLANPIARSAARVRGCALSASARTARSRVRDPAAVTWLATETATLAAPAPASASFAVHLVPHARCHDVPEVPTPAPTGLLYVAAPAPSKAAANAARAFIVATGYCCRCLRRSARCSTAAAARAAPRAWRASPLGVGGWLQELRVGMRRWLRPAGQDNQRACDRRATLRSSYPTSR
jgi:hypothetical protein